MDFAAAQKYPTGFRLDDASAFEVQRWYAIWHSSSGYGQSSEPYGLRIPQWRWRQILRKSAIFVVGMPRSVRFWAIRGSTCSRTNSVATMQGCRAERVLRGVDCISLPLRFPHLSGWKKGRARGPRPRARSDEPVHRRPVRDIIVPDLSTTVYHWWTTPWSRKSQARTPRSEEALPRRVGAS
jgi:hypothetical protein